MNFEVDLNLSSKGIRNIPMDLHEGEFEFIVSGVAYKCSLFIAEFISPKICSLRKSDPSIIRYALDTEDLSNKFGDFLSIPFESHLKVLPQDFDFFVSVTRELENEELLMQLISAYHETHKMDQSNAAMHLRLMQNLPQKSDAEEISFIASRFSEIEDLASLDVDLLRRILGHPSLRIESEDSLYEFICSMIKKDPSYSELLEFVVFKFLSRESIEHFIMLGPSFIFGNMNLPIWNSICDRLLLNPMIHADSFEEQIARFGEVRYESVSSEDSQIFVCNDADPFNGVMADLTRKCGGNPDRNGLVSVTSSGAAYGQENQLLDYECKNSFYTKNEPDSWIQIDLKDRRILLTHYTLRAHGGGANFFTDWIIQGSDDGSEWRTIHKCHSEDLTQKFKTKTYTVGNKYPHVFYRYIRLTQTKKNTSKENYLMMSKIELFGILRSSLVT